MKRFFGISVLLIAVLGVVALSDTASATNAVLDDFTAAYPAATGTALDSCSTCHTSVPALNAYGSAVWSSGFNFSGIAGLDSDGDGFTNAQEIQALTNPGNAADRPTTTTTTSTTSTTAATSPTSSSTTTTSTTLPAPSAPGLAITVAPSGPAAFDAGPAGTVWLAIESGRLVVTEVETTWRFSVEEETDDDGDSEIEIKFRSGDREVEFEAELEDGVIKAKVEVGTEEDSDNDDGDHHDYEDHEGEDHDDHDDHKNGHDDDDDDGDDYDD